MKIYDGDDVVNFGENEGKIRVITDPVEVGQIGNCAIDPFF